MGPGFHCVRTHWIRGFTAFQLARRTRTVRLMVLVGPETGFGTALPGRGLLADRACGADRARGASGADVTSWYSTPARRPTGDIRLSGIELSGIELRSGSAALSSREGKGGLVGFGEASELRR